MRLKEIIILDRIRNNVELFSEEDDRCAYEFIKQVEPLHGLMETEAYTVLTEELLTNAVRRKIPPHVKRISQVYRFLIEEFGGASSTLETWVTRLEVSARIRPRGNRARLEAIEAALKLCERFMNLAPTVPKKHLEALLSNPRILARILSTLQEQDSDLFRDSLGKNCSPSIRRGTETLGSLRKFLKETATSIAESGPPVPLYYHYTDYLVDVPEKDPEHHYYGIQQPRVCAEEDDRWWDPSLTYPCGLPGHVHELAFCQEFWYLAPEERHQKLLPGSICVYCI